MSEHNITVQGGSSVRLPTAGKYCDRDIVVTAEGGGDPGLPGLANPAAATDIVKDKQVIGADGSVITGTVEDPGTRDWYLEQYLGHDFVNSKVEFAGMFDAGNGTVLRGENPMVVQFPASYLGNAAAGDVAAGKTFTSAAGLNVVGTAQAGGGTETVNVTFTIYGEGTVYYMGSDGNMATLTNPYEETVAVVKNSPVIVWYLKYDGTYLILRDLNGGSVLDDSAAVVAGHSVSVLLFQEDGNVLYEEA